MVNVTQEDITMFGQMFAKLSTIIVDASELGQQMPELRKEIDQLRGDIDDYRKRNQELDEILHTTRVQRDEAQERVKSLDYAILSQARELEDLRKAHETTNQNLHHVEGELKTTKSERDDSQFRVMELEDENKKLRETLDKFQDLIQSVVPPKPVAIIGGGGGYGSNQGSNAVEMGSSGGGSYLDHTNEAPVPPTERQRLFPGDQGYQWEKANHWDGARGAYYHYQDEVAA